MSLIDPLTQLLNRRALNELVPREVARANRLGSSLTFMAIDLNGFSGISSKFGALEGDKVLIEFAKILKTVFRGADLAFRQGGDEFLIMMPDTTEEQADCPVQRISGKWISGIWPARRATNFVQLGPGALCHRLGRRRCSARRRPQDVLQEAQTHARILKILKRLPPGRNCFGE